MSTGERRNRPATRMYRWAALTVFAVLALAPGAPAEPANTLREMWARFQACLDAAPGGYGPKGSEITILFALKRDGTLLGRPRITHSELLGDLDEQKLFVARAISAIEGCLPLDVTPGLGGAIAGRPLALRIINGKWRTEI